MHQSIKTALNMWRSAVEKEVEKYREEDAKRWAGLSPTDQQIYAAAVMAVRKCVRSGHYWGSAVDQVGLQYGLSPLEWDRLLNEAREHLGGAS